MNLRNAVTLANMTWEKWKMLPATERFHLTDRSQLTPQLLQFEGFRVEVVDKFGETRRFKVGRSTGWRPIHLELKRRDSSGGNGADKEYKSVRVVSAK